MPPLPTTRYYNAAIVLMNVYSAGAEVTAEEEALLAQGTFAYMGGWQGVFWMLFYVALLAWAMRGFLRVTEHSRRMHGIRAVPAGRREAAGRGRCACSAWARSSWPASTRWTSRRCSAGGAA